MSRIDGARTTSLSLNLLVDELVHLRLGPLGRDRKLNVPCQPRLTHGQRGLEAKSVVFSLCYRHGIQPKPPKDLSSSVNTDTS